MKKTLITFLILTTSIGFSQDSEWTYLFDGETLNGWHEYNGGEVGDSWSVKNGELILSSKNDNLSRGNDIITDKKFTNFELSLEWNIVKGGNSGVFSKLLRFLKLINHGKLDQRFRCLIMITFQLTDIIRLQLFMILNQLVRLNTINMVNGITFF